MAEEESEKMGRYRTGEISANEDNNTFMWSKLPKDAQHKVLSYLPVQILCQLRCVCKEWRDVIHRRDFCSMFDAVTSSRDLEPRPVMCYLESSYPARFVCTSYDHEGRMWKKMGSFPSPPQSNLTAHNVQNHSLFSVGGLLLLYRPKFPPGHNYSNPDYLHSGVSSWTVWHPFRNRWKRLPPCKYKVSGRAPFFVHAFVSDAERKTYKIVMAHLDPDHHSANHPIDDNLKKLVTEIYDSATGVWTDGAEHTLKFVQRHLDPRHSSIRRGVLCGGVVYFETGGIESDVLLLYDIDSDQWDEHTDHDCDYRVFEWDGHLMSIRSEWLSCTGGSRKICFTERDAATRVWSDTGIEIPTKLIRRFPECDFRALDPEEFPDATFEIVASGNRVALTGYSKDGCFRIAVYRRAENYWRVPPAGAFNEKLKPSRVGGLVLHTPRLEWRP
ncbi:hypothetical protein KC19_5G138400 [Ceratodon purpureus]|uniref:F-box domain-containing protein n=1 Tax=Ceratodon purpureus TaxID=3225 RepID=A0A8T0I2N3_CERPU|nr:hypothetical protein KC19_5G138400 [Ceratodon purpureus]